MRRRDFFGLPLLGLVPSGAASTPLINKRPFIRIAFDDLLRKTYVSARLPRGITRICKSGEIDMLEQLCVYNQSELETHVVLRIANEPDYFGRFVVFDNPNVCAFGLGYVDVSQGFSLESTGPVDVSIIGMKEEAKWIEESS